MSRRKRLEALEGAIVNDDTEVVYEMTQEEAYANLCDGFAHNHIAFVAPRRVEATDYAPLAWRDWYRETADILNGMLAGGGDVLVPLTAEQVRNAMQCLERGQFETQYIGREGGARLEPDGIRFNYRSRCGAGAFTDDELRTCDLAFRLSAALKVYNAQEPAAPLALSLEGVRRLMEVVHE